MDKDGAPVYALKTSGSGAFDGCDAIAFDYVLQVFPSPMNPLTGSPAVCLSGKGSKVRVPVVRSSCQ